MGTAQRVCERKSVWVGLGWSLEFYVEMSGWVVESNLDRTICPELRNIFPLRNTRAVKKMSGVSHCRAKSVGHVIRKIWFSGNEASTIKFERCPSEASGVKHEYLSIFPITAITRLLD